MENISRLLYMQYFLYSQATIFLKTILLHYKQKSRYYRTGNNKNTFYTYYKSEAVMTAEIFLSVLSVNAVFADLKTSLFFIKLS